MKIPRILKYLMYIIIAPFILIIGLSIFLIIALLAGPIFGPLPSPPGILFLILILLAFREVAKNSTG